VRESDVVSGPQILDLAEAAQLLGTPSTTVARWARQGLLSCRVGRDGPRFERAELKAWARRHGLRPGVTAPRRAAPEDDLLTAAVARGAWLSGLAAHDSREVITRSIEALGLEPAVQNAILEEVLDRERMASTALGGGVAVPHPRTPPGRHFDRPVVALATLAEPVDWAAIDAAPVSCSFLLLSPSAPIHLELLSRVAHVLHDPGFLGFLAGAPDHEELLDHLRAIKRED